MKIPFRSRNHVRQFLLTYDINVNREALERKHHEIHKSNEKDIEGTQQRIALYATAYAIKYPKENYFIDSRVRYDHFKSYATISSLYFYNI